MTKVQIDLPQEFDFSTEFQVCIDDVFPGGHLRNYRLISMLNEAHLRFMQTKGFFKLEIDGLYFINADLEISYESESFHGDVLTVEVAVANMHKYGCDLVYRVTNHTRDKIAAVARTGMLFYDYRQKKAAAVPESFKSIFS